MSQEQTCLWVVGGHMSLQRQLFEICSSYITFHEKSKNCSFPPFVDIHYKLPTGMGYSLEITWGTTRPKTHSHEAMLRSSVWTSCTRANGHFHIRKEWHANYNLTLSNKKETEASKPIPAIYTPAIHPEPDVTSKPQHLFMQDSNPYPRNQNGDTSWG